MQKYIKYLLALIPALLVFLLVFTEPFDSLDAMLGDLIYTQMNGTGDTIKLIAVDEETLQAYGPLTDWSREKAATLIETLNADSDKAPAVLAFDFMFVGDSDETKDEALAQAAGNAGNVITATNLVYRGKNGFRMDGTPYFDVWNIEMEERPYDSLDKQVESGYANVLLSKDGFVRVAQLKTTVQGEQRYSFATQIYRQYMKTLGKEAEAEALLSKHDQVQFFYSGKPGEFIRYSMKDVLDGKIPMEEFTDCVVMVGVYAPGLQDAYHSAAKRGQDMYGVEINANIVRALQTEKMATRVNPFIVAIIAAILLYLYTFMAREMKMYPALLIGVWILMAEGVIGRVLATHGHVISLLYIFLVVLLVMAWVIIEKYVWETIKRKRVLNSFKKYMAPQVIDNMAKNGDFHIELGGERRQVAVLFVDIRGFTAMSETLQPEEIVQILNQYLSLTTECIFAHGGMLDKFIGDATMAIFNAPNDQEDYIYKAILAGLDMQKKGAVLGEKLLKEYGKTVSFGVGVNIGDAVVGNIGCDTRMDYTAIGDTVNTASRIEGKAQNGELLISEETFKALEGRIVAEFKEDMVLKGKKEPVKVYRVFDVCEVNTDND